MITLTTRLVKLALVPFFLVEAMVYGGEFGLRWMDNSNNETGFQIERAELGVRFQVIAQTGPNETSYTDTTVTDDLVYFYRICAFNNAGRSTYTNILELNPFFIDGENGAAGFIKENDEVKTEKTSKPNTSLGSHLLVPTPKSDQARGTRITNAGTNYHVISRFLTSPNQNYLKILLVSNDLKTWRRTYSHRRLSETEEYFFLKLSHPEKSHFYRFATETGADLLTR